MITVYAVNVAIEEKEEYDNEDFICFEESEREQAEKLADVYNVDVDEWTLLYSFEWYEMNWRDETLFKVLEAMK